MTLDDDSFLDVVERAPLVSIDLIVRDARGHVLLGRRVNRPAKDWWFVPGGRIRKGETLDAAFERTCLAELGRVYPRHRARPLPATEHFYDDNAGGRPGFGTHYVVLPHEIEVPERPDPPREQHDRLRWAGVDELLEDAEVHPNVKAYFEPAATP